MADMVLRSRDLQDFFDLNNDTRRGCLEWGQLKMGDICEFVTSRLSPPMNKPVHGFKPLTITDPQWAEAHASDLAFRVDAGVGFPTGTVSRFLEVYVQIQILQLSKEAKSWIHQNSELFVGMLATERRSHLMFILDEDKIPPNYSNPENLDSLLDCRRKKSIPPETLSKGKGIVGQYMWFFDSHAPKNLVISEEELRGVVQDFKVPMTEIAHRNSNAKDLPRPRKPKGARFDDDYYIR